ncbi:hypothetical protein Tco_0848274 [Tanacetum coccineum]
MLNCMTNMKEALLLMDTASEKPYNYSVVENTCNKAKLDDLDETGKGIVIENILYVPREGSSLKKKRKKHPSPADDSLKNQALLRRQPILAGNDALGSSSTTAHAWTPGFSFISLFQFLPFCCIEGNAKKQEKKRQTCGDYRKYEESHVRIKCGSISKKKKSNYSSFQDLRLSYNRDMVKYKGPQPSTTQERALNEKSNKKIPPATSQPPDWRVCHSAEGVPPGRRLFRPALGAHVFHFTLEET